MLFNSEAEDKTSERSTPKLVWVVSIVVTLLSLPPSRFQSILKVLFCTFVVIYAYCPYVLPYVRSWAAGIVFGAVCVFHLLAMYIAYPKIAQANYLILGMLTIIELLVISVPGGWIVAHSPRRKRNDITSDL